MCLPTVCHCQLWVDVDISLFFSPAINFEAAWALTNIVSGTSEQTEIVVNADSLDPLVKLLYSTDLKVADQAAWALGNIAG